jgi:hypothetical protein
VPVLTTEYSLILISKAIKLFLILNIKNSQVMPPRPLLETRASPSRGKGLFISEARANRDVLFREQPQVRISQEDLKDHDCLVRSLTAQVQSLSQGDLALFNRLHTMRLPGVPEIENKFETNAVPVHNFMGLYLKMRCINHACLPTAEAIYDSDGELSIRLLEDVSSGREITINYWDVNASKAERQSYLKKRWGFTCECFKCLTDEA